jgi:hypothetical protein
MAFTTLNQLSLYPFVADQCFHELYFFFSASVYAHCWFFLYVRRHLVQREDSKFYAQISVKLIMFMNRNKKESFP